MHKSTKFNRIKHPAKRVKYNQSALQMLADKHGVTKTFIRLAISDGRESEKASEIKKEYNQLVSKINNALDQIKS